MIVIGVLSLLLSLPLLGAAVYLLYYLMSLPMRRQESVRLLLDLLETGAAEGRDPEETLRSAIRTQDPALGGSFERLAEPLCRGSSLAMALEEAPELASPVMCGMLKIGRETGDIRRVLPACRQLLRDANSTVQKAQSYLLILCLLVLPIATAIITVLQVWVWPKMQALALDIEAPAAATSFEVLGRANFIWTLLTVGIFILLYFWAFVYVWGSQTRGFFRENLPGLYARLQLSLPWKRHRLQRDYSAMLGVLLDAGQTEEQALLTAASATANQAFQSRAELAVKDLRRGVPLTEAVRHLDDQGEFRWRLANAARAGHGFSVALAGWRESLDARAFQQEQQVAHLLTSGLVLWNGLIVAMTSWCVFHFLVGLIQEGVLW